MIKKVSINVIMYYTTCYSNVPIIPKMFLCAVVSIFREVERSGASLYREMRKKRTAWCKRENILLEAGSCWGEVMFEIVSMEKYHKPWESLSQEKEFVHLVRKINLKKISYSSYMKPVENV